MDLQSRLLWLAAAGLFAGLAVGICLLPYHSIVSIGGEGAGQWAIEEWLAGGRGAYSLRQLAAGDQPYAVAIPAMVSPALQALRQATLRSMRWQLISSVLHALFVTGSLLIFCFLTLLSLMVASSAIGVVLVFLWHLGALGMAVALGARSWGRKPLKAG